MKIEEFILLDEERKNNKEFDAYQFSLRITAMADAIKKELEKIRVEKQNLNRFQGKKGMELSAIEKKLRSFLSILKEAFTYLKNNFEV